MAQEYRVSLKDSLDRIKEVMSGLGYSIDYEHHTLLEGNSSKLFFEKAVKEDIERFILLKENSQNIILIDYGHVFDSDMENFAKTDVRLDENLLKSEEELLEHIKKATELVDGQYLPNIEQSENY